VIEVVPDLSDLPKHEDEAERILRAGGTMVSVIERRLKEAALTERLTHKYQNQTTHLQQSTAASVVSETDNEVEVHLEMGEEYTTYVVDRGLSEFENLAADAFQDIDGIIFEQSENL
jgi:hypothetical protein